MATRKYSYRRKRTGRKPKRRSRKRTGRKPKRRRSRKRRSGRCPKKCWKGYKRVPGKGCGKGSCTKA